jgi:hypothetical protein
MASLYGDSSKYEFRRHHRYDDDTDPMASVANISDAMLVFACGLLIALVTRYGVELVQVDEIDLSDTQQVEDVEAMQQEISDSGKGYVEVGTVYVDPNTGERYLLESSEGAVTGTSSDTSSSTDSTSSDTTGTEGTSTSTSESSSTTSSGTSSGGE